MKKVIDEPLAEVKIKINDLNEINKINNLSTNGGKTKVKIDIEIDKKKISFELKDKRKIDHKMLNLLRKDKNIEIN